VLANLGRACMSRKDAKNALEFFEEARRIRHSIGDQRGESLALTYVGSALVDLGEATRGIQSCERALHMARCIHDEWGESAALSNLGTGHSKTEPDRAINYYDQAIAIQRHLGNRRGEANNLFAKAKCLSKLTRWRESIETMTKSAEILEEIKAPAATDARLWLATHLQSGE
jgi:tetratricopeptide (TPR) repeat protein